MRIRYSFSSRRNRRIENTKKQRAKYPDILDNVIMSSDIILEVLDARFPEKTRNFEIEKKILGLGKLILYVLNKSDLISNNKKTFNLIYPKVFVSCKNRKGIKNLRVVIKKLAKKIGKEKKVFVGVIGYPNTGKSSLINILIGKSSAGTALEAGFTKGLQKVRLDKKITLIDSPGIIPENEYSSSELDKIAKHSLVGGRSFSQVKEPDLAVAEIVRAYPNILDNFYKIPSGNNPEKLIDILGKQKGFMKKGNLVDEDRTARFILRDWQTGKIKI